MVINNTPTRIKEIHGNEYLYYIYYENGKKTDVYRGLASKSESKRKAVNLEIEGLKNQREKITKKINQLALELKNI